jgi:hypothetical protein
MNVLFDERHVSSLTMHIELYCYMTNYEASEPIEDFNNILNGGDEKSEKWDNMIQYIIDIKSAQLNWQSHHLLQPHTRPYPALS